MRAQGEVEKYLKESLFLMGKKGFAHEDKVP
jgi:hypothetical protein